MKKEIFLSFKPDYFRPILYNIKKYEYRKRFCNQEVRAYLYLSSPVNEVVGVMELGVPIKLDQIIKGYEEDLDIHTRIKTFLENKEVLAIPIQSLQLFSKPVHISEIKKVDPNFTVPQAYLYLENKLEVLELLKNQKLDPKEFINDHNKIYEDNLAVSCKEMELTEEFWYKDKEYINNAKYSKIKSKYLTKGKNTHDK